MYGCSLTAIFARVNVNRSAIRPRDTIENGTGLIYLQVDDGYSQEADRTNEYMYIYIHRFKRLKQGML